jgi:tRNA 2-thiouridine synthesizing protein A
LTLASPAREIQPVNAKRDETPLSDDPLPAADAVLDARDLACPLPVLKARKRLAAMAPGALLRVEATDPMAAVDLPNLCREEGHRLVGKCVEGRLLLFVIERGG